MNPKNPNWTFAYFFSKNISRALQFETIFLNFYLASKTLVLIFLAYNSFQIFTFGAILNQFLNNFFCVFLFFKPFWKKLESLLCLFLGFTVIDSWMYRNTVTQAEQIFIHDFSVYHLLPNAFSTILSKKFYLVFIGCFKVFNKTAHLKFFSKVDANCSFKFIRPLETLATLLVFELLCCFLMDA